MQVISFYRDNRTVQQCLYFNTCAGSFWSIQPYKWLLFISASSTHIDKQLGGQGIQERRTTPFPGETILNTY